MSMGLSLLTYRPLAEYPRALFSGHCYFFIYINDLDNALYDCKLKLYADDTVLYQFGVTSSDSAVKLQKSLDKFCLWATRNKLTINVKKTKLMVQ